MHQIGLDYFFITYPAIIKFNPLIIIYIVVFTIPGYLKNKS